MYRNLPPQAVRRIEELVDASYSGRDELYAAADALDDERRSQVCRQLADHLAGHATELQQLLMMNGGEAIEPLDLYSIAESFFGTIKRREGEAGVLNVAEACERTVKERFEQAIEATQNEDTAALLERQRDNIEFGENVLKSMQEPPN